MNAMREDKVGAKVDQYELTELLAESGMASIYKARDIDSGSDVVLKIPHLHLESDVVFFQRFQREEEIGQRLDHPNIVKVLTPKEKTRAYLAMEYARGRSLRALLDEKKPLPTSQALAIARQLADALAYVHAQGVVHRDLKPENVLISDAGEVKIIDFGIALDSAARRLTWVGLSSTVGTPDYMAPEQVGGRRGDARTDVYAVGTMLYEMLTGHLPFDGDDMQAILRAKANDEPRSPTYYVPALDPALETIILRSIQRRPRDRYADARELLADLKNPAGVKPLVIDPDARGRRRVPRQLVFAIVIAVIVAALGLLIWQASRRVGETTYPPAAPHRQ